jgi:cellulose synthase operon protein C
VTQQHARVRGARHAFAALALLATLSACNLFSSPDAQVAKGRAALAAGDSRAAAVYFKGALQSAPERIDARLGLAEAALALADPVTAVDAVAHAERLHAPATELEPVKWRAALAAGHYQQVADALSSAREGLPEATRTEVRADALVALGHADQALELYKASAGTGAPAPELGLGYARALAASGHSDDALAVLEALIEHEPGNARALVAKAETLYRAGHLSEAGSAAAEARKHVDDRRDVPTYLAAQVASADVGLALGHPELARDAVASLARDAPGAAVTKILQARLAITERRYEAAVEALTPVVARLPDYEPALLLLGTAHALAGHPAQAETHFIHVLALRPDNRIARRYLAEVELSEGRPEAARATVEPFAQAASPDVAMLTELGRVALATREAALAAGYFERAVALAPSDDGLKLELATAYNASGRPQAALALLDQLPEAPRGQYRAELQRIYALPAGQQAAEVSRYVAAHVDDASAQLFAAAFHVARHDEDAARQDFEAAIRLDPTNMRAFLGLARLELRDAHYEAAQSAFTRLGALKSGAVDADIGLAQIASAKGDEEQARRWLEQARGADAKAVAPRLMLARAYAAQGQYPRARTLISEALNVEPARLESLTTAAQIEERAGDSKTALSYVDRLTEAAPSSPEAWLVRGQYHASHGDAAGGRRAFEKALELRAGWPQATANLAALDLREGDSSAALALAHGLESKPSSRLNGLELRADIEVARGDFARAVAAYDEAIALAPGSLLVLHRYAAASRGQLPGALSGLTDWLAKHPEDVMVRFAYAQHLQIHGDLPGARREYERIVAADPKDPIPLNNLAYLYHAAHDPRALELARRAYALAPTSPPIADTLGWILAMSGQVEEAVPLLASAAAKSPKQASVQYHYAWVLAKSGKKSDAKQLLEGLLSNQSAFPERSEAEALAKEL